MSAANYVPLPGSAAARAVDYLRALPIDTEVVNAVLAEALAITPHELTAYLATPVKRGVLYRERREGRIYWSLTRSRPPAPPTPQDADPDGDSDDIAEPIARTVPSAAAAPIPGVVQQAWCPVAQDADAEGSQDEPAEPAAPIAQPAPAPTLGLGWKAPRTPVFHRDAAPENTAPADDPDFREVERTPAPETAEPFTEGASSASIDWATLTAATITAPMPFIPAPRPVDNFRCALWSNGILEMVTSEGETLLLNADDTRGLLRYVGDMLSARARAAA